MVGGSADLVDFPKYFAWTSPGFRAAQESGADFLFTAADGITKLPHEMREWDPLTSRLCGYVKLPRISPRHDTLFFLYYGNPSASNQEDRTGVWKDYSFVGRPEKPAEHALGVLEALFTDPGLQSLRERGREHPAIRAHDALLSLIRGPKFDRLTWKSQAADIGAALLDSLEIREVDPSSTWYHVAEPEALRQIRSRLASPDEFEDQFAVIRCWSLLHAKGAIARLVERAGFPDLHMEVPSDLWIEVKRLRLGTRPARVRDVISKANRQLKNAAPQASGLVYLQVTRVVSASPLSDQVPLEVQACINEVHRELRSGHSKGVGRVAIAWDDMAILGEPPALTKIVLRRRTVVLDHPAPLNGPVVEFGSSDGRTVDFNIRWR
jgi:hypothetical protein